MADYFNEIILKGRMLDKGISNLEKIWKAPHIYIGGYVRFAESENNLENLEEITKASNTTEALSTSLAELKEHLLKDLKDSENNLSEMQQFMKDSKITYDVLIQQCSDIETLFMENGYVPITEEITNSEISPINSEDSTLIIKSEKNLDVDSTPYLPWKSKLKAFDASTPEINHFNKNIKIKKEPLEDFETPLTKKLFATKISYMADLPSPREPILSRYCNEL